MSSETASVACLNSRKTTDEILVDIYDDRSLNSGGLDLFSSVRV